MDSYLAKENYITVQPNKEIWKYHPNYHILIFYSKYIKGVCGDIGCNHGAVTLLLLEVSDKIEKIYGFDINYEALKIAYENAIELNSLIQIIFICTNILDNTMEENTFDFLMSFHTLEHIYPQDAKNFADQIYRLLKPGGHFLITIPYEKAYPDPAHVAFYNVESLCELLESSGLECIECMKDNRWIEKELLTGVFFKPLE